MNVPPPDHPAWTDLVRGRVRHRLDFFAGKITLGWLILKVESDPSPEMIQICCATMHNLFAQNVDLPCVQHDLQVIFGEVDRDRQEHGQRSAGED